MLRDVKGVRCAHLLPIGVPLPAVPPSSTDGGLRPEPRSATARMGAMFKAGDGAKAGAGNQG